jgi:uncharacterized damage-inducible protein DinB
MDAKLLLVDEFERRVFSECYSRIYKCLNLLSAEEIWRQPAANIPPAGCLILHLCGNARQWIVAGIGGKDDVRDRPNEFIPHPSVRKSDLVFVLENLKVQVREALSKMKSSDLEKPITIQGINETYFSVIIHVLEHFSYHTGQITTLTKLFTGKQTQYYDELHLNNKIKLN